MVKAEMRQLARIGAVQSLKDIERKIVDLYRTFPDLFVGKVQPQLLKPEMRNGGGPTWPSFEKRADEDEETETDETPHKGKRFGKQWLANVRASWTPKRRREQGERLRRTMALRRRGLKRRAAPVVRRKTKRRSGHSHGWVANSGKPYQFFGFNAENLYNYVGKHSGQTVTQIAGGLGIPHPANISKQLHDMVAIGLLVRDPKTKGFTHGDETPASLLKAEKIKPREARAGA